MHNISLPIAKITIKLHELIGALMEMDSHRTIPLKRYEIFVQLKWAMYYLSKTTKFIKLRKPE